MNLTAQKRLIRKWGLMYRLMRKRRDRAGAMFAIERARIWRGYVNLMERRAKLN